MEQHHFLALARTYGKAALAKKIADVNRFYVRLTNMLRTMDPTSKIFLAHYAANYKPRDSTEELANLILNIVWVRNSMSKEILKMCEQGKMPWLRDETGRLADES